MIKWQTSIWYITESQHEVANIVQTKIIPQIQEFKMVHSENLRFWRSGRWSLLSLVTWCFVCCYVMFSLRCDVSFRWQIRIPHCLAGLALSEIIWIENNQYTYNVHINILFSEKLGITKWGRPEILYFQKVQNSAMDFWWQVMAVLREWDSSVMCLRNHSSHWF